MALPLQDDDLLYIPLAEIITIMDRDHDEDVLIVQLLSIENKDWFNQFSIMNIVRNV